MTQNRPPTQPGPGPEEPLSARDGARDPDVAEHGPENGASAPGTESSTGATDAGGAATAEPAAAGVSHPGSGPVSDEEARTGPWGGKAPDGASIEDHGSAERPAVEDARSREELLEALIAAESARDEYLEDLRRTQAEFQNFRKRTMREGALQREQGTIEVLARLIDVLDDFELAMLAAESASEVASLHKGIEMVYGKFVEVLQSFGLEKIGQEGVPFDPQHHDAVQRVEGDEGHREPVVAEVLRPGYLAGGRVLRPAMVKVVT